MDIFVINLDRAPDRLAHMRTEFAAAGLDFIRLPAVDGRQSGVTASARMAAEGRRLSPGEVACFMSHRACWERIVQSAASHGVVMEDDIHLGIDAAAILKDADWIPPEADLVKIETYRSVTQVEKAARATVAGRRVSRLHGRHQGAGGYVVSRAAAGRLLALSAGISEQVDDFLFHPDGPVLRTMVVHQLSPALCIQGLRRGRSGGDVAAPFRSGLYEERRQSRRRLSVPAKIAREAARALIRCGEGLKGLAENLFGTTRRGRIPFR